MYYYYYHHHHHHHHHNRRRHRRRYVVAKPNTGLDLVPFPILSQNIVQLKRELELGARADLSNET